MYNLLVSGRGWNDGAGTLRAERLLEYTAQPLADRFQVNREVDLSSLIRMPALFLAETGWNGDDQFARVGSITGAQLVGDQVAIDYLFDPSIPGIPNRVVQQHAASFQIADFEFSRTHWAVKDVDLYKVLLRHVQPRRRRPSVFQIPEHENIESQLISAMMPFHPQFDAVYGTLQNVAGQHELRCRRADDIWDNPAVMQDVVNLIDRSQIVIADCTGRNPNVFYEIGIAHTLGREVILITQSEGDIPFDLRHLRYVRYLPNGEGLDALAASLSQRLGALNP